MLTPTCMSLKNRHHFHSTKFDEESDGNPKNPTSLEVLAIRGTQPHTVSLKLSEIEEKLPFEGQRGVQKLLKSLKKPIFLTKAKKILAKF